jgi:hypothetical protein
MSNYKKTRIWRYAFEEPRPDCSPEEQRFFLTNLEAMRDRAAPVVARILRDMPGYTVHDISHLDALWEMADLIGSDEITLSPPEAFVFGGAVLLHDAAMTLAAYPRGIEELKELVEWKDIASLKAKKADPKNFENLILIDVLRILHARTSERLATQPWSVTSGNGKTTDQFHIIEDPDLRKFYGPTIGIVAHSHWWPITKVENKLNKHLGAMPPNTRNDVDILKLACLLRVSDACHLDRRRAPPFIRALDRPTGLAELHWQFQGRLAFPRINGDALQFTASEACPIEEADSWWLGYDAFTLADKELRETDLLLRDTKRIGLKVNRVKGVSNPIELASDIPVTGWKPVNSQFHVSDVPRIVETLGGSKLYGGDSRAPLRELLQNSADAIQARRRLQDDYEWGKIKVCLTERADGAWLAVEDDGVGMSERVLTKNLLDFGSSFWRSSDISEEFPGLAARGMSSIGRFGIGFFSVFMLGDEVTITTRRYDFGVDKTLKLSLKQGISSRPILSIASAADAPKNGGTKVEVKLRHNPHKDNFFSFSVPGQKKHNPFDIFDQNPVAPDLHSLIEQIAPASDITIESIQDNISKIAVKAKDWILLDAERMTLRASTKLSDTSIRIIDELMRPIVEENGEISGRAALWPSTRLRRSGILTSGGFRIQSFHHLVGLLRGDVTAASRNSGSLIVGADALRRWSNEQAKLIARSKISDEQKAESAEIILECGGSIGKLPIAELGGRWLNRTELIKRFKHLNSVSAIIGRVTYDDDTDDVSKSSFENEFEMNSDIFVLPSVDTPFDPMSTDPYGRRKRASYLVDEFEKILTSTWGGISNENQDDAVVGEASFVDIIRSVIVYEK